MYLMFGYNLIMLQVLCVKFSHKLTNLWTPACLRSSFLTTISLLTDFDHPLILKLPLIVRKVLWFPYSRLGSFRVVSNGWDDPGRPRRLYGNYTETTANDHERPTTRVVSDRIEFYPDDPKRPRDDQKRQKRLYGNIEDDPKQAHNAF